VLDWQTVSTQPVKKSRTSAGAERQAQFSVTSSQPEESASPIGIMQLKRHEGADCTAGRAVMLYSGELSTLVDIAADIAMLEDDEEVVLAERTRDVVKERMARSFMIEGAIVVLGACVCHE
jgi:hypothetical protein